MPSRSHTSGLCRFALRCAFALFLFCMPAAAQSAPVQTALSTARIAYMADAQGTMTVQQAASPASIYRPFVSSFRLLRDLPDAFNGAVWLRIAVPGREEASPASPASFNLDMGNGLPGVTRLFTPQRAEAGGPLTYWQAEDTSGRVLFPLPGGALTPSVVYARIDGTPGLWFKPVLSLAPETPPLLPLNLLLPGALAAALLMQLLRFGRERREWRLWAALLAGTGLVQCAIPALPAAGAAYAIPAVCAMIAPGIALMLLSHTARHLFATPGTMPGADKALRLYPFAGAALALAPLAPNGLWLAPYLPFWPLFALPLTAFAAAALSRGRGGALGFFCVCLMPVVGIAASLWEMTLAGQPIMGAAGGLWGLALGSLALALASASEEAEEEDRAAGRPTPLAQQLSLHDDVFASLARSGIGSRSAEETAPGGVETPAAFAAPEQKAPAPSAPEAGAEQAASESADDPEPSYARAAMAAFLASGDTPAAVPASENVPVPDVASSAPSSPSFENIPAPDAALSATPETMDEAAPPVEPETPAPVEDAPGVPAFAPEREPVAWEERLCETFASHEEPAPPLAPAGQQEREEPAPRPLPPLAAMPRPLQAPPRRTVFDLALLVREAYDDAAPLAEQKNMGLTWFISPQVGRAFNGEAELLYSALRLLLRDMVASSERGTVRLSVRRLPDSPDAGHLMFTLANWDGTAASRRRDLSGMAEAWDLAERTGGMFNVEHSPLSGTTLVFSAAFASMGAPAASRDAAASGPGDNAGETALAVEEPAFAGSCDPAGGCPPPDNGYEEGGIQIFAEPGDAEAAPLPPVLPAAPEEPEEAGAERDPARILVADMAAGSRRRLAQTLAALPRPLLEAADAATALRLYRKHPSGILIANADMPESDIMDAVSAMREADAAAGRPDLPVLALVSHEAQAQRLLAAGCTETLSKPVDPEALREAVQRLAPGVPAPEGGTAPDTPDTVEPERALQDALADIPPADGEAPAPEAPAHPVRELPLLDLIITDIDPDRDDGPPETGPEAGRAVTPETAPGTAPREAERPLCEEFAVCEEQPAIPAPAPGAAAPESPRTARPRDPVPVMAKPVPSPRVDVSAPDNAVRQAGTERRAPQSAPVPPAEPSQPDTPRETEGEPSCETFGVCEEPAKARPAQDPEVEQACEAFAVCEAPLPADAPAAGQAPSSSREAITVPLPGENDSVFRDLLPLVPGLLYDLSDAMAMAAQGKAEKKPTLVRHAAGRVADKAATFGLAQLERMARCVERAAAADDIEPMECVLDDLENWVTRYKKALRTLHRDMRW